MKTFGTPVQLAAGLMVMWGDRSSCAFSLKHNFDNFWSSSEKKLAAYNLNSLWYLKQEHTAEGKVLTYPVASGVHLLPDEGDYLITNVPTTGIGIITADCLPIVFFDSVRRVVAVVHAGWKGSVQGIAPIVLRQMQQRFGTELKNIQIWFGPHANPCCYEVTPEFRTHLLSSIADQVILPRDGRLFFDTARYNELLLIAAGVHAQQIDSQYSFCTMCSLRFHSRRNDGALYIGQSSIAWLQ